MKLKINKDFADKYNSSQKKIEFQKLKDKYKNGESFSNSSSSESEDENAEALTDEIEKNWFSTLSAIIGKDPKIYDPNFKFFHNVKTSNKDNKVKSKSMFLKDYERNIIMEHEGKLPEESINFSNGIYNQEQVEIKEGFKQFLDSDDEIEEDFLKKRIISNQEKEKEDKDYIEWIKGQKEDVADIDSQNLISLKNKWSSDDIDEDDKFLKDYLLNKRYLDEDDERLPTYDEIVLAEADEEQFDKEEIFAIKYNHRYEEPDQDFIKSYPRTIKDTVRVQDVRRAEKRKQVKERKNLERKKKKVPTATLR